jgi:hypothetical protein
MNLKAWKSLSPSARRKYLAALDSALKKEKENSMPKIVEVQHGDVIAVTPGSWNSGKWADGEKVSPKVKHFFLGHNTGWMEPYVDKETGETRDPHDPGGVVYRLKNDSVSLEYVASFPKTKDAIDYIKERS